MDGPLSRYLLLSMIRVLIWTNVLCETVLRYVPHIFADQSLFVVRNPTKFVLMLKMFFYLCGVPRITYQSNSNYPQKETTKWASYMLMMIAPRGLLIICLVLVGVFGRKLERGWLIISK